MVGHGGAELPGLEPSSSPRGVQALLPAPDQIQGGSWVLRCLARARTSCSKYRNTPRGDSGPQHGQRWQQQWCKEGRSGRAAQTRDTGCRTNTAQSRQLSSPHPCAEHQGCLPTWGLGSAWWWEPRKSKRQQLLNHGSPFIAQLSRAETQEPAPGLSLTQPAGAQRSGDRDLGAGGSPIMSLLLPTQALQQGPGQG